MLSIPRACAQVIKTSCYCIFWFWFYFSISLGEQEPTLLIGVHSSHRASLSKLKGSCWCVSDKFVKFFIFDRNFWISNENSKKINNVIITSISANCSIEVFEFYESYDRYFQFYGQSARLEEVRLIVTDRSMPTNYFVTSVLIRTCDKYTFRSVFFLTYYDHWRFRI